MRNKIIFLSAFGMICFFPFTQGKIKAQSSTKPLQAKVTIVDSPLQITVTNKINFGTLLPGGSLGTIIHTPGSFDGLLGNIFEPKNIGADGFNTSYAKLTINGQPNTIYNIQIDDQTVLFPKGDFELADFVIYSKNKGLVSGNSRTDGSGEDKLVIGATISVSGGSSIGEYTGCLVININY